MAKLISVNDTQSPGEVKMLNLFAKILPGHWYVVGNPIVSNKGHELDAVVIGEYGVWAVEDKGYHGRITGDDNVWILSGGKEENGVIGKIIYKSKMVKCKIKIHPHLEKIWVEGLITLSSDDAEFAVDSRMSRHHVRYLKDCEAYFRNSNISAVKSEPSDLELILRCLVGDIIADRHIFKESNGHDQKQALSPRLEQGAVVEVRRTGSLVVALNNGQLVYISEQNRRGRTVHNKERVYVQILGVYSSGKALLGALPVNDSITVDESEEVTSITRAKPIGMDNQTIMVRLDGDANFRRVYYDDVLVGPRELRGLRGFLVDVKPLQPFFALLFQNSQVILSRKNSLCHISLEGKELPQDENTALPLGESIMRLGSTEFKITVMHIPAEVIL